MTARCPRKPIPKQKADPKICISATNILLNFLGAFVIVGRMCGVEDDQDDQSIKAV